MEKTMGTAFIDEQHNISEIERKTEFRFRLLFFSSDFFLISIVFQ